MTNNLLKGSKIILTSFKEEYFKNFTKWYNDMPFLRNYDMIAAFPRSIDELKPMIDDVKKSSDKFIFAIKIHRSHWFRGYTME